LFFSIGFWKCWAKISKTSRKHKQFLQCCQLFALLLSHPTHKPKQKNKHTTKRKNNRKNNSIEVHDWLNHRVVFLVCELDAKTKEQNADNIQEID
jgi:hypothetical protein